MNLLVKRNAHVLLFGTSHIGSVRDVIVSAAEFYGQSVETRNTSRADNCDDSPDGFSVLPFQCGISLQTECTMAHLTLDHIKSWESEPWNTTITTISNHAQYQLPHHSDQLDALLKDLSEREGPFTHAYFMHAHDSKYFEGQCIKQTAGVSPDPAKYGDAVEQFCDITKEPCQASSPAYNVVRKHAPNVAVADGIQLKHDTCSWSEPARIFNSYRDLLLARPETLSQSPGEVGSDHACIAICTGYGTNEHEKMRRGATCEPAEGAALAWHVLKSTGALLHPD